MPDLRWDDVREWFDPFENGSLPDVIVPGTTLTDWETLLRLIRSEGWRCEYDFRERGLPLPASAADLFTVDKGWLQTLHVWPDPGMEWSVRPARPDVIDSDVSLFEIQGQERLDVFCGFLRTLGKTLDKRVLVYAEGDHSPAGDNSYPPMMAYELADDRVVFLARPGGPAAGR
ncbi:hypothetical protein GCE86_27885 [Micromonospora terminaliae]|uniref:Uncharacterized protein n=1 Tax=Micromonospora terminaliae TaxID=1914461 RepID=A0AAJ2ZC58_9ACTN|nr:hypothetical protein [Micromonospora terminaliae]NES26324.1 hypothetical protein [Micromonospora terminaliae]QGL50504.1 hypothetical protein GCE86_27885 [Micromonospora terminaliae]